MYKIQKLYYYQKDEEYDYYRIDSNQYINLKLCNEIMIFGNPLNYEYEFALDNAKIYKNSNQKEGIVIMTTDMVNLFSLENSNQYKNIEIKKLKNCYVMLKSLKTFRKIKLSEYKTYKNSNYIVLDSNINKYIIEKDINNFKYINILYPNDSPLIYLNYDNGKNYYFDGLIDIIPEDIKNIIINIHGTFYSNKTILFLYNDLVEIDFNKLSEIVDLKNYCMNLPYINIKLYTNNLNIISSEISTVIFDSNPKLKEDYNEDYYCYSYLGNELINLNFNDNIPIDRLIFYIIL